MKPLFISLLAGTLGIAATLAGLAWDAWLHAADPTLAQREGIFSLTNPGHALLGLGVLLTSGGVLAALHVAWNMAQPRGFLGRPYVRTLSMRLSALGCAGAVVFALAVSSSGDEHAHADGEPHAQTETSAASPVIEAQAPVGSPSDEPHEHGSATPGDAPLTASNASSASHEHNIDVTPEKIACGNELVRETKEATARFADINVALAEGYRNNPDKPGATHYGNPLYKRDGKIMDLAHPESLVYFTRPKNGETVLLGALFTMPRGQDGPQPCGAATSWHTHTACANRATGDVIPVEPGTICAEGYQYGESVQMMHVWFVPGRKNGVAPVS